MSATKLKRRSVEEALAAMGVNVADASSVLVVGRATGPLVRALALPLPITAGLVFDAEAFAEAQASCTTVEIVDPDATDLPERVAANGFDLAVFDGTLEYFSDSPGILRSVRTTLHEGGSVVAAIPNLAHAAIRLAVLRGALDNNYIGVTGAGEAERMFEEAGFEIAGACRVLSPAFGDAGALAHFERSQFSNATVKAVEADSEADTSLFLIRAIPAGARVDEEFGSESSPTLSRVNERGGNMGDVPNDDEFASAFGVALEMQRRESRLERELNGVLAELDRERGRAIAIEAQSRDELAAVKRELTESKAALSNALETVANVEARLNRLLDERTLRGRSQKSGSSQRKKSPTPHD